MVRKPRWRTRDIRSFIYPRYGYPWCTRPSTQALLYLVPSKYLFLPSSRAHSSEITFIICFPSMVFQNFPKPLSQHFWQVHLRHVNNTVGNILLRAGRFFSANCSVCWFNRANDWIGAIKAIALQRLFARVTIKTRQKPETAQDKSLAHRVYRRCLKY